MRVSLTIVQFLMKIFQWQIWQEKKSVWLDWESIPGCSLDHFIYTTEYSNSNGSRMNSHQVSFYGPDIWGLPTHYKGLSMTHLPHVHFFLIFRGLPHDLSFPQSSRMGGISLKTRLTSCGDLGVGLQDRQLSTCMSKELSKNILTWPLQVCPCWCSTVYGGVC